jgi:hypothetical protein
MARQPSRDGAGIGMTRRMSVSLRNRHANEYVLTSKGRHENDDDGNIHAKAGSIENGEHNAESSIPVPDCTRPEG